MTERCETCRFWRRTESARGWPEGDCRRRSPTPLSFRQSFTEHMLGHIAWSAYIIAGINPQEVQGFQPDPDGENWIAVWPETAKEDWCGDYDPAKDVA
jgi:hypothetical protein